MSKIDKISIEPVNSERKRFISLLLEADEGGGVLEIKNIATAAHSRGKGYGRAMIDFLVERYCPLTVPFYEKCGFKRDYVLRNFFTDNYDRPIIEGGINLTDMVYFTRDF